MKLPDATIANAKTLYYTDLHDYKHTGNTTHRVGGQIMSAFSGLVICQYHNDSGYYLFYCDEKWTEITDTYHDSIEGAMKQAAFEYEGLTLEKWKQF